MSYSITHDQPGWRKRMSTEFINRYVFPDGELDTVGMAGNRNVLTPAKKAAKTAFKSSTIIIEVTPC